MKEMKLYKAPSRESAVEKRLREGVEALGGQCLKWVCPQRSGVPDRILILPKGITIYVELKDGSSPSALQKKTIEDFTELGHRALVVTGEGEVDMLLTRIRGMLT